jgi:hypothetical protein
MLLTVAVIVHNAPTVALEVYVDDAVPVVAPVGTARVVAAGALPQPVPVTAKVTAPPLSAAFVTFVTETLTVVEVPIGTLLPELLVVTVTTLGAAVACVTTAVPETAVSASLAVIVQLATGAVVVAV